MVDDLKRDYTPKAAEQKISEPKETRPAPDRDPPIQLSSILRWSWGITMSLSNQEEQKDLINLFKEQFNALINENVNIDVTDQAYLNEISIIISGVIRSYGFQREVFITNIRAIQDLRQVQVSYYMNMANPTSVIVGNAAGGTSTSPPTQNLSPDLAAARAAAGINSNMQITSEASSKDKFNNLTTKIITFLGSGSLVSVLAPQITKMAEQPSAPMQTVLNQSSMAEIVRELGLGPLFSAPEFLILTFLLAGSIGYGIYSILANRYAYNKVKHIQMQETEALQEFWTTTMKPSLIEMYVGLVEELKLLHQRYYNKSDNSLPNEDARLRKYISEKILPNDNAYRYRFQI